ncbi:Spore germination protein YaaH [Haloechinothrix alba]|uniref:Spore germination protein YaaH n=1 Tax=Haloechinothrix alba TaxID=664784 RepID=A0A238X3Z5_9PSEU|nr:glycosyl hydrolase family 18 protein [Haloechinothrix alba]SNR53372.1 Spore germination protein YaaH [Haloechinothrix alba]
MARIDRPTGRLPTRLTRRTLLVGAAGALMLVGYRKTVEALYGPSSPTVGRERRVAGYVPYYDQQAAFDTADAQADVFDLIHPVWYSLEASGEVVLADDEHVRVDRARVRRLKSAGVRILPTCTNLRNGSWEPELVKAMLADPGARRRHVEALVELAVEFGYDGIDIDYEDLTAAERDPYSRFLESLGDALRAEGKSLISSVYAKHTEPGPDPHSQAQDYAAIGAACDQVGVMAYDFHWADSQAGPTAPRDWVEETVSWAVTQIPPEKVRLGIVLLGYDWPRGGRGETVTYEDAMRLAEQHDVEVLDERSADGPHFVYTDGSGREREVWFENAYSAAAKLELVDDYDLGGAFFWRLGYEDTRTWDLIEPRGS